MIARVLSLAAVREGKQRVVFECEDDGGRVFGPFVEHRPAAEDAEAFAAAYAASLATLLEAAELADNVEEALNA